MAIYPIDARGVAPPDYQGITTADTNFRQRRKLWFCAARDGHPGGSTQCRADERNAGDCEGHGRSGDFNNDIAKTLRNEFDRSESYYTISYTPANTQWNDGYRRIQLSLDEPGNQLIYREGYYAKDPQSAPTPTKEEFRLALGHGAPVATGVLFSAKVSKSADAANVEYTIDPRTIEYQADASGQLVASADCAIVEYDAKGKAIATSLVRVTSTVSPERRPALNMDGLRAKQRSRLSQGRLRWCLELGTRLRGGLGI